MPPISYHLPGDLQNEIALERWQWEVRCADGSVIKQFGDDGIFHRIGEVSSTNAIAIWMVNGHKVIKTTIPPGGKAIHFYRNTRYAIGTPQEASVRLYVFGYEIDGVRTLQGIYPDDSVTPID